MLDKLESILEHFAELDQRLAEVGQDYQLAAELSKERSDLEPIVMLAREYKDNLTKTDETRELIELSEGELLDLAKMELEELALTDPLTHAFNRRAFFENGAEILHKAQRDALALTLIMLDVDHFKEVNDGFGHM